MVLASWSVRHFELLLLESSEEPICEPFSPLVTEAGEVTGHTGPSLRVKRSEPKPDHFLIHSPEMSEQNCHGETALTLTVEITSDENRWEGSHACWETWVQQQLPDKGLYIPLERQTELTLQAMEMALLFCFLLFRMR